MSKIREEMKRRKPNILSKTVNSTIYSNVGKVFERLGGGKDPMIGLKEKYIKENLNEKIG